MASLATSQTTFRCALPPSTLRRLTASRPIRPPARKQEQRRQCRALPVTEARRSNSGDRRQSPAVQVNPTKLLKEYGLPALGLLVAASVVAPLLGGLVFGAVALGVMASFSWIFVPVILALFGLPALMAAGVFATAITGALIVPSLISLALLGGGLWLGSRLAQRLFGGGSSDISPDGTIDVEARTVDEWKEEDTKEQRERDAELREFDELLRRREQFKQGYTRGTRGPPYP